MKNQMNVVMSLIKVIKTVLTNISQSDMETINNIEITSKTWTIIATKQTDTQFFCFIGINDRNVAEFATYKAEDGSISFSVPEILLNNITESMLYAVSLDCISGLEELETIIRTAVNPCIEKR